MCGSAGGSRHRPPWPTSRNRVSAPRHSDLCRSLPTAEAVGYLNYVPQGLTVPCVSHPCSPADPNSESRRPSKNGRAHCPAVFSLTPDNWLLTTDLQQLFAPVLQELLHLGHELVGHRSVNDAMVIANAEVHHRTDGDGVIAVLVGNHDRLFQDSAHAQNRNLRLIDDGHPEFSAKNAGVGDGERPTLHFVGLQLLGAGTLAEVGDGALQSHEAALFGVLDDGHD